MKKAHALVFRVKKANLSFIATDALVVSFLDPLLSHRKHVIRGVQLGQIIGEANTLARNLSNRPDNAIYPQTLGILKKLQKEYFE